MRVGLALYFTGMLALAGCRCERSASLLQGVELDVSGISAGAGLRSEEVREQFLQRLTKAGGFRLAGKSDESPGDEARAFRIEAVVQSLDTPGEKRAGETERAQPSLVVGSLLVRRGKRGEPLVRYELFESARVEARGDGPQALQEAHRAALGRVLDGLAAVARAQVAAVARSDSELVAELSSKDERAREVALWVLADRRRPEAVERLLTRLGEGGLTAYEVRRSIGVFVDFRERRAVPKLIDLAREAQGLSLQEVIYALGAIGGEEAQAYLYTLVQGHDQPAIVEAAKEALGELESRARRRPGAETPEGRTTSEEGDRGGAP